MMKKQLATLIAGVTLSFATIACNDPSSAAAAETSATTASAPQLAPSSPAATKATRIVFVGQKEACNCTRRAVDAGWAALETALGKPAKLPVARLELDTEAAKVEPYWVQKALNEVPAIYFVDANDVVVELLQGEVTAEQIGAAMRR